MLVCLLHGLCQCLKYACVLQQTFGGGKETAKMLFVELEPTAHPNSLGRKLVKGKE